MPSSVIETFAYDEDERRLMVRFVSGLVYVYASVPGDVAAGFRDAPSKGQYFNESIRDRFSFARSRKGRTTIKDDKARRQAAHGKE
jgi:lysyl-tRNA synthetase class 2